MKRIKKYCWRCLEGENKKTPADFKIRYVYLAIFGWEHINQGKWPTPFKPVCKACLRIYCNQESGTKNAELRKL